jgi:hypothetical protein
MVNSCCLHTHIHTWISDLAAHYWISLNAPCYSRSRCAPVWQRCRLTQAAVSPRGSQQRQSADRKARLCRCRQQAAALLRKPVVWQEQCRCVTDHEVKGRTGLHYRNWSWIRREMKTTSANTHTNQSNADITDWPEAVTKRLYRMIALFFFCAWWRAPQQMLRAHHSLRLFVQPYDEDIDEQFFQPSFIRNGAPVELNWQGKTNNSEKNLSQYHFVHHKFHMDWPGIEPGPPRWEAGEYPPEPWHGQNSLVFYSRADKLNRDGISFGAYSAQRCRHVGTRLREGCKDSVYWGRCLSCNGLGF